MDLNDIASFFFFFVSVVLLLFALYLWTPVLAHAGTPVIEVSRH